MTSLFCREPEALDYTPKFTIQETLLGYQLHVGQTHPGFGAYDEDWKPERTESHSITVAGKVIYGKMNSYSQDSFDIAAMIANEFTGNKMSEKSLPEVWQFLVENAVELNNSRRYWIAYKHRQEIEATKKKVENLQEQIRRAEWIASMYAVQAKSERWLSETEKNLLLAEFSGGEYKKDW